MTDKVQKILSEIATRKLCTMDEHMAFYNDKAKEDYRLLSDIEEFIKALQEEPVSEVLDEAAFDYAESCKYEGGEKLLCIEHFKAGAKWQETKDKQVLNEEGVVVLPDEAFERMKRSLIELAEKEQQMTANAFEGAYIRRNKYTKKNVLNGFDVTCDAIQGFKNGDKVKVIVIKED